MPVASSKHLRCKTVNSPGFPVLLPLLRNMFIIALLPTCSPRPPLAKWARRRVLRRALRQPRRHVAGRVMAMATPQGLCTTTARVPDTTDHHRASPPRRHHQVLLLTVLGQTAVQVSTVVLAVAMAGLLRWVALRRHHSRCLVGNAVHLTCPLLLARCARACVPVRVWYDCVVFFHELFCVVVYSIQLYCPLSLVGFDGRWVVLKPQE